MSQRWKKAIFFLIFSSMISSLQASSIYFKLDENGKKIYYNIPSRKNTNYAGGSISLYYSDRYFVYASLIEDICARHGVDPELVKAVIQVESNFDHRAVSPKGARGLMQLMPATAARYGVRSIFDPEQNIEGGVRYLRDLLGLFNSDLRLALAAYNAGENRVQRVNDIPTIRETQNYVRKVLALYNGEMSYIPYGGSGPVQTVTYYKYVDEKGVTHYSTDPFPYPNATKVSFAYAW